MTMADPLTCAKGGVEPSGVGDLPSTAGIVLTPLPAGNWYGWWADPPLAYSSQRWVYLIDAESVSGGPVNVGGLDFYNHDGSVDDTTGPIMITIRSVYRIPTAVAQGTDELIGLLTPDADLRVYSICVALYEELWPTKSVFAPPSGAFSVRADGAGDQRDRFVRFAGGS